MKKETIMVGVIGLLLGVVLTGFAAGVAVNNNYTGMTGMMGINSSNLTARGTMSNDDMSMSDMAHSLKGKTGDDFDKAFVSEMIIHHQGAIDMAKLAGQNARHDEVKKLAEDIIAAQNKEITEMKQWQSDWGYSTKGMMEGMGHSGH